MAEEAMGYRIGPPLFWKPWQREARAVADRWPEHNRRRRRGAATTWRTSRTRPQDIQYLGTFSTVRPGNED